MRDLLLAKSINRTVNTNTSKRLETIRYYKHGLLDRIKRYKNVYIRFLEQHFNIESTKFIRICKILRIYWRHNFYHSVKNV